MRNNLSSLTAEQHKRIADNIDLECEDKYNKKKLKEARYHCNEALRLKRDYADAYYRRAEVNLKLEYLNDHNRDIKKAIRLYKEELRQNSDDFNLHFKLGLSWTINYQHNNHREEAIKYFQKALSIKKDSEAYYHIANLYQYQLNAYNIALEFLDKAIDIVHDNPDYYFSRAIVCHRLNIYDDAIQNYNKAIELDSSKSLYYQGRGELFISLKEWVMAEEDYKKYRDLSKDNYEPELELIKDTCGGLYFDFYLINEKEARNMWNDIIEHPFCKLHESAFYVYYTCFSDIKSFDHYGDNEYNSSELNSLLSNLIDRLNILKNIKTFEEFFDFSERVFFLNQLIREFEDYRNRWESILISLIQINAQLIELVEEVIDSGKILCVLGI